MELREMIQYNFKSFTGIVWSDNQVDEYNRLQERINTALNAGIYPENLINASHNMFSQFSFK